MINVVFKNLEKSETAQEIVLDRIGAATERFPELKKGHLTVTVTMENSPVQAGRDSFAVKLFSRSGKFGGILLKKSASNLYVALAEVCERLLERLGRFKGRQRDKRVNRHRQESLLLTKS